MAGRKKFIRGLTEEEEKFVSTIADGGSHTEACKVANVSRNTGYSFLRRAHVQEALAQRLKAREDTSIRIKEEFQATRTKVVLTEIDEKLKTAAIDAVKVLIEIMNNGKRDADRIAACDRVIKLSGITEHQTINTEKTSSRRGLSEEAATEIRKKILGISDDAKEKQATTEVVVQAVPVPEGNWSPQPIESSESAGSLVSYTNTLGDVPI
jgi:hypothetical protein